MKKVFLPAVFLFTSMNISLSQTNESFTQSKAISFNQLSAISELNHDDLAEAYPWISDDGLTLYYVGGDFSNGRLQVVHRSSINEKFGEPKIILSNFDLNVICL